MEQLGNNIANGGAAHVAGLIDEPLSDLGRDVADLMSVLIGGMHQMKDREIRSIDWNHPASILINYGQNLDTFDGSDLTRLVILAHDAGIRVGVVPTVPANEFYVTLMFSRRTCREGEHSKRHPTMEAAIANCRASGYVIGDLMRAELAGAEGAPA